MKTLLLTLLVSGSLVTPESPTPQPASEFLRPCEYGEVYRATSYYQYQGGPQCGTTYQYCYSSNPPYHEGCTTSYYDVWYPSQCYCP
jgi:hypothetical protein